ncbi:ASST-domain-containing protein [Thelonectria olida]|uniref:ASST-domain-containing protein n=1 Tax=Thelonectria olida TaxID=1576542 RepID=A0A9P8WB25_9HYPO|nr:ASST-domain-containing protein [Thelonectria olida]
MHLFFADLYPQEQDILHSALPWFSSHPYVKVVQPDEPSTWPYRVYKSSPYKPPYLDITGNGGEIAEGYLFFTPSLKKGVPTPQNLPLIMGQDNELVFCMDGQSADPHVKLKHLRPQMINGTPHITVWQGLIGTGHGYGQVIILDDEYMQSKVTLDLVITPNIGHRFPNPPPGIIDFHEGYVTSYGTIIVTAYNNTPWDLTPLGGPRDGWAINSMFYEIDLKTMEIVFSWKHFDHFDIARSYIPLPSHLGDGSPERAYDPFHLNAVQRLGDTFLVNSKHHCAVYMVSRNTGEVMWELDGRGDGGSFGTLPPEARFRWQHHARAHNLTHDSFVLSLFDNHNGKYDKDPDKTPTSSRGLVLELSLPPNPKLPPKLLRHLDPPNDTFIRSQGSFEIGLSNHNQLVGYGESPVFREYGPTGDSSDIRSEIRFAHDNASQNYRVFKSEWRATPRGWSPSLVYEKEGDSLKGYVSWNGATEVEWWKVYTVERGGRLEPIGKAFRDGFETVINIPRKFNGTDCIAVAAMQGGEEIRQSNIACLKLESS